mgnify:CR=1 FL=1
MPELNAAELAELASRFRRGKEIFKQFYEEGPLNPETGTHKYTARQAPEDEELQELAEQCNLESAIGFMNETAAPKTARGAYFTTILCLGSKAMDLEERKRDERAEKQD